MSPKLAKVDQLTRDRFGFLHKPHFRCAFLLFIGTIPLGLGKAGKALGGLMIINALLNEDAISEREAIGNAANARGQCKNRADLEDVFKDPFFHYEAENTSTGQEEEGKSNVEGVERRGLENFGSLTLRTLLK